MQYYGTRLSENISRREPEGYLLCLNVPVARTGTQDYLPEELGLPPGSSFIPVLRPEEEVFSPETVASFEGMPVTNDHPPDGVDVSNIRALQKGHAHNVRRGSGEESDLLLADLIITDPDLISAVLEDGKREISCGYTYELCEENGRYIQRKIRGNHVAVVDAGRAGPRVSIKDEHPARIPDLGEGGAAAAIADHQTTISERRKNNMKKSLSKVLARMAKDGDAETVAEIIEEMIDPSGELPETPEMLPEQSEEEPETQNIIIDEDGMAGILERLDRIIALLQPSAADEDVAEEVTEAIGEALEEAALRAEDPMAGEVSAIMEEILDPVASAVLESGEEEEENGLAEIRKNEDALRAAMSSVRPVLSRMSRKKRLRMAADIAARLRRADRLRGADVNAYRDMSSRQARTAPVSAELGKRIMEKRNVSYRGRH